jgi:Na+-translocating ferredoxin:NAD+ oxidoreductase subunit B
MIAETAPDIVARIDALLPQTQCTRCGYAGCEPYAAAIASGNDFKPGRASASSRATLESRPRQGRACARCMDR